MSIQLSSFFSGAGHHPVSSSGANHGVNSLENELGHGLNLKDRRQAPIGVFDSGLGGLTVLLELYRQLPHESVLYVGDTARLPYGTRSQDEIIQFVRDIMTWMEQQRVKMVIMACNTSSALALDAVREEFSVPVLGLILPGARAAARQGRRVGVIATPATVQSHAYREAILETDPAVAVWEMACPAFVPLIEQGRIETPDTLAIARQYLEPLMAESIDTLIYGCTHYPLLAPVVGQILPSRVQMVNPGVHVAAAAAQELDLLDLRNPGDPSPTRFYVSGCPEQFAALSHQWLGFMPPVHQVDFSVNTWDVPEPAESWLSLELVE